MRADATSRVEGLALSQGNILIGIRIDIGLMLVKPLTNNGSLLVPGKVGKLKTKSGGHTVGPLGHRGKRTSPAGLTLCQRTLATMPDPYAIVAYMSPKELQAQDLISEFSRERRRLTTAPEWNRPRCDPRRAPSPDRASAKQPCATSMRPL
jgi:hypothetical protein